MNIHNSQIFLVVALGCLIGYYTGHHYLLVPFWFCLIGYWLA